MAALREAITAATAFCAAHEVDLAAMKAPRPCSLDRLSGPGDGVNALIGPDSLRREFFSHEKFVSTLYHAVKPDPAAIELSVQVSGLAALAGVIRGKLKPDAPDIATILKQIGELPDDSISGMQIGEGGHCGEAC